MMLVILKISNRNSFSKGLEKDRVSSLIFQRMGEADNFVTLEILVKDIQIVLFYRKIYLVY
jgi:hypothetical protein